MSFLLYVIFFKSTEFFIIDTSACESTRNKMLFTVSGDGTDIKSEKSLPPWILKIFESSCSVEKTDQAVHFAQAVVRVVDRLQYELYVLVCSNCYHDSHQSLNHLDFD